MDELLKLDTEKSRAKVEAFRVEEEIVDFGLARNPDHEFPSVRGYLDGNQSLTVWLLEP